MRPSSFATWSNTKVFIMMAGLTALLGLAGHALGGRGGLVAALLLAAAGNAATYFWSARLVLRAYGARVVTPAEAPALCAMVDRLRQRAGLPMPAVAVAPHAQPNAFATGRDERHAVVCVTQGLLDGLDREELEGVIAHELAHIRNRDVLLMTVTATIAGAISNVGQLAALSSIFGHEEEQSRAAPHPLAQLFFVLLAPVAAMLVQLAISRQREFRADALGAAICGRPRALARALIKLEVGAQHSPMAVAPAVAPLAQVNPLGGYGGRLGRLFSTHPPTHERIDRLDAIARVPTATPSRLVRSA